MLGGLTMVMLLGLRGEVMEIVLLFEARRPRGIVNVLVLAGRVWVVSAWLEAEIVMVLALLLVAENVMVTV